MSNYPSAETISSMFATADHLVRDVEAMPDLLLGSIGTLLVALLHELKRVVGPSPQLIALIARIHDASQKLGSKEKIIYFRGVGAQLKSVTASAAAPAADQPNDNPPRFDPMG